VTSIASNDRNQMVGSMTLTESLVCAYKVEGMLRREVAALQRKLDKATENIDELVAPLDLFRRLR
jgi:hypothetical protein